MTVDDMQHQLDKRSLRMQYFRSEASTPPHVVWLWADDDPGLGVIHAEGRTLELAFRDCLSQWDGIVESDDDVAEEAADG